MVPLALPDFGVVHSFVYVPGRPCFVGPDFSRSLAKCQRFHKTVVRSQLSLNQVCGERHRGSITDHLVRIATIDRQNLQTFDNTLTKRVIFENGRWVAVFNATHQFSILRSK